MIHPPDNADSIIAHLASRLEFFNSLSQDQTLPPVYRSGLLGYHRPQFLGVIRGMSIEKYRGS